MDIGTFINNEVTKGAVTELVRERLNPADRGYLGAEYMPEIFRNITEYKRNVVKLGAPLIAADVAPLTVGRFASHMKREKVGGGLIDSGTHFHYHGVEIEDFAYLISQIQDLQGDTVRADMPALSSYMAFVENHLLEPLDMNRERKRWTLMGTGRAWQDGQRDDDLTLPPILDVYDASQSDIVASGNARNIYDGASPDFFKDYQDAYDRATALGYTLLEAVMHPTTRQQILSLDSTKNTLGMATLKVNTGGSMDVQMSQGMATVEMFNAALASRDLPPVRVYGNHWSDMVRNEGDPLGDVGTVINRPYIPKGRIIFVPRPNPMDMSIVEPDVPQQTLTPFGAMRRVGIHVIGRPTAQSEGAKIYVFGPNYNRGANPNMNGDAIMAHMPFLNYPGGFQITEYQVP